MSIKTFFAVSAMIIATAIGTAFICTHRNEPKPLFTYNVPVSYTIVGIVKVKANSWQEACAIAGKKALLSDTAKAQMAEDTYNVDTTTFYQ